MTDVLLGDDDSAGADLAWLWVNAQRWGRAHLTVLRAEPPHVGEHSTGSGPRVAEPWRETHDAAGFADVSFCIAAADPRLALAGSDVDLIVVGPARSGSGPRHIGSTTEWLLHDPPAPVALVRRGKTVRQAIVCADGSAEATSAASALAALPWAGSLAVEVVSVDDGRTDPDTAIEPIATLLRAVGATVTPTLLKGRKAHREILAHLDSADVDLVVLGTHGLGTLRRLTLGSTASAVARLAPCSVLISS